MQSGSTNRVFLLLGTNLGDRSENLLVAKRNIEITAGKIIRSSSAYATAAWGKTDQPNFLNQVVEIDTTLTPGELLSVLLNIESLMGRIRENKWGPRIIDVDILLYDQIIVQTESLTIPHPAMHLRKFTLMPLAEIAADVLHPIYQKPIRTLLEECADQLTVVRIEL